MKANEKHSKYRMTETTVYQCRYHIIFCPKYRRKVLTPLIQEKFKEIVMSMQKENNYIVLKMKIMPEYVHLYLDIDPTIGVDMIVSRIKGKTSNILNKEFPELKKKLPTLWSRSKFISTEKSVLLATIKAYTDSQKAGQTTNTEFMNSDMGGNLLQGIETTKIIGGKT